MLYKARGQGQTGPLKDSFHIRRRRRPPTHDTNLTETRERCENDSANHRYGSEDDSTSAVVAQSIQGSRDTDDRSSGKEAGGDMTISICYLLDSVTRPSLHPC